jgi:hypothetical protein
MKPYIIYTNITNAGLNNHSDYLKQKNIIVDVIQNT